MVARTPPKQQRLVAPLNPLLIRETVKKVDKCMARLQELQNLVASENKKIGGVSLSPKNTRSYRRTSLRCKQESLRFKNATTPKKSPVGKFPAIVVGEWRSISLPAMLVGETVGEILQASQFAKEIVALVTNKAKKDGPETPGTQQRKQRPNPENTELKSKRRKEKQDKLQSTRLEFTSPSLQRVRSRINFKVVSPQKNNRNVEKENATNYFANRVSPKNRPWARKTVLFPNPLFLSTDSTQQQKFCRTRSPVISRSKQTTPHKFLIKSPPSLSKFQVKIKSPPVLSISPTNLNKKSPPKVKVLSNLAKKSPPKVKVSTASKLRRSFSPSRLANRLVSPLKKNRSSMQKNDGLMVSGLKQRPVSMSRRFSLGGRI